MPLTPLPDAPYTMSATKTARAAGFTLIELLIVITIIGLLAAALVPNILGTKAAANAFADSTNLTRQFEWLTHYKRNVGHVPTEGGHKFLLDIWVKKVCEHSEESFDRFFTPGAREEDPHYIELRKKVQNKENPWPDLNAVTSADTHYAGRSKDHLRGMESENEAWIANDNEGGWCLQDGTINIIYGGKNIRSLSIQQLTERFQWVGLEEVFPTWGPQSPHPDLKKLDK
ncbi:MAG: prepilin-type N-terminal cleavage/methylation domain-containing protein [Planctomycetes bacterium]|nr:prepilin-type N-terminal cleavage/methylation domain-containing protein [Planctomycetota bacterium]